MNCCSQEQLNKISSLVREVEKLNDVERLLLYLQLPCGRTEIPEGKYKANSGGSSNSSSTSNSSSNSSNSNSSSSVSSGHCNNRQHSADIFSKKSDQETTQTYTWILSHLEEDPNVSLPKQEVYDDYRAFCQANKFEPLCVADFGKAMKHALPCIKPRRLGQRGNSRYCYSGLRKKYKIEAPSLPDLTISEPSPMIVAAPQTVLRSAASLAGATTAAAGATTEHYYASNCGHDSQARVGKIQCSNSNLCDYSQQTTTTATLSPTKNQQHATRNRHDATNATATTTALNIKLEPCNSTQAQCNAGASNSSPVLPDCCNLNANPFNTNNNGLPLHVVQQNTCSDHPYGTHSSSIQIDNPAPLCHPNNQQQQQTQLIGCGPSQHYSSQTSFVHRSGTPDDDDYRHNYHDLNRPIVGPAIIPFSQSLTAQLAQQSAPNNGFISYNNPLPPTVNHLPQQDNHHSLQQNQNHSHHQHQHQHPPPLHHHQQQQQQQQSVVTNSCCRDTSGDASTKIKSGAPSGQQHLSSSSSSNNNNENNNHQQRHNIGDEHQYEISNNTGDGASNNERDPMESLPVHQHPSDSLQLNLSLFNHCTGSNMDYCASPFQSPASTPYPKMTNFPTAPDTQDYYSSECIPYSDQ